MLTPDTKIPSLSSQSERKLLLFTSLMHTKAKYTSSREDLRSVFYCSQNKLTVLFFFFFFYFEGGEGTEGCGWGAYFNLFQNWNYSVLLHLSLEVE